MAIKSLRVTALSVALVLVSTPTAWSFPFSPAPLSKPLSSPRLITSCTHHTSASCILKQTKSTSLYMSSTTAEAAVETNDDEETPLFEPLLKGIKRDYKMRLPLYKSDVTDGLNSQCLAATLFLFFACLAPAVGFGALFGSVTNGAIGTMEMVSSTAMCGFIYALTSAQPLTIIGSTGPVLAFVATLVKLAEKMNLPFLPLYAWTGLWTSLILFARCVCILYCAYHCHM